MKTVLSVITEKNNDYSQLEALFQRATGQTLTLNQRITQKKYSPKINLSASIVIPTYNSQSSILACLSSIEQSSFNIKYQGRLQVIVVDDGSTDRTWKIIKDANLSIHLTALRQKNHGQAQALNTGISVAQGDIIISCDSDMILGFHTIEHFVTRHTYLPNALFAGFRYNTPKTNPRTKVDYIRKYGTHVDSFFKNDERILFPIPGWPENMCLASHHFKNLGQLHKLWMPDDDVWLLPDMVFGALFSLKRSVYLEIGGYDERFKGWGCTDNYLAAKAIGAGQYIIPVYAASGLHINHPVRLENKQEQYENNRKLFIKLIKNTSVDHHPNWLSEAKRRIIESFTKNPTRVIQSHRKTNNSSLTQDSFYNQIDNLLATGGYSQALTAVSSKHKAQDNWKVNLRLGRALFGLGKYDEATEVLNSASVSTNQAPETTIPLIMTQAARGYFINAKRILNKFKRSRPQFQDYMYWYDSSAERHIAQGKHYVYQKFYQVALRCFEAALIIEPSNLTAYRYRERCLHEVTLSV